MAKWMSVAQVKEKIKESSAEEVTAQYLETIGKSKVNGYITVLKKLLSKRRKLILRDTMVLLQACQLQ